MIINSLLITLLLSTTPAIEPVDNSPRYVEKRLVEIISRDLNRQQAQCASFIAYHESRFGLHSRNKQSGAYGVFQLMRVDKRLTLQQQIDRATRYAQKRYGSFCKAKAEWQEKRWW